MTNRKMKLRKFGFRKARCNKCKYFWHTKTKLRTVTCPSCRNTVWMVKK